MKNVRVIGLLTLCFLLGLFTVATISGCSDKKEDPVEFESPVEEPAEEPAEEPEPEPET